MAKILNSISFTNSISKFVELQDDVIVNGSVYDKMSLSPKPLQFAGIVSADNAIITTRVTCPISLGILSGVSVSPVVADIVNPDIHYAISNTWFNTSETGSIYEIVKYDTYYTVERTPMFVLTESPKYTILSQDINFIYIGGSRHNTTTPSHSIATYDKKTKKFTRATVTGYGEPMLVHEDATYLYVLMRSDTKNQIIRYTKNTTSTSAVFEDPYYTGEYKTLCNFSSPKNNSVYSVSDSVGITKDTHNLIFKLYTIDTISNKYTSQLVNTDNSILESGNIELCPTLWGTTHNLYNFTDNGKEYMVNVITTQVEHNVDASYLGIYVYEKISALELKLVGYNTSNIVKYTSVITVSDNKTLILANQNTVDFYEFNPTKKTFEKTNSYVDNIQHVGVDMADNIYIQNKDSSVDMVSRIMAITSTAEFNKEQYDYNGVDIAGDVYAYSQNYAGEYLTSNVEITLSGNAFFADGSKKHRTVTSNVNKISIPIVIKGPGMLKVNIKNI